MGNGPKDVKPEEEADFEARKVQTRTLLTNKKDLLMGSSRGAGVRLEKLPEEHLAKTQQSYSVEPMDRNTMNLGATETKEAYVPKTVNKEQSKNMRVMEQNFIKEYRHLEEVEREKGIKFF